MLTCLKNGGPCAVSSRAWGSFFNVMRLGPIVSATGCCSVPFFASKEVLSTLVSHGNSLRSIQLNWAFGGLLQYAQEMNWEQKIDISEHQKASKSKSIHAPNDAILVAYGTKSGKASNHDALSITVRCNWAMYLASIVTFLLPVPASAECRMAPDHRWPLTTEGAGLVFGFLGRRTFNSVVYTTPSVSVDALRNARRGRWTLNMLQNWHRCVERLEREWKAKITKSCFYLYFPQWDHFCELPAVHHHLLYPNSALLDGAWMPRVDAWMSQTI